MKFYLMILGFATMILLIVSCESIMFRNVDCRKFELTEEYYWFPNNTVDSVVFSNSSNERKAFVVVDKSISHRSNYTSDTGCGCLDESGMLLVNSTDSLWFKNELRYVENNSGNRYVDVVFTLNGLQSVFFETHRTILPTYSINSLTFNNVQKFEYPYTESVKVKTVYMAKNLGIIRYEMVNGEIWTNGNISNPKTTTIESFIYSETTCE